MNSGKISQNRNRTKSPRRKAQRKKTQTKILSHFISTDPKDCELLPSLVCHLSIIVHTLTSPLKTPTKMVLGWSSYIHNDERFIIFIL